MLTPSPNEFNSMLTSVTRGIHPYPNSYIDKCRTGILQLVLSSLNFRLWRHHVKNRSDSAIVPEFYKA